MIRNMPEQRDSEFTWKNFQETHNSELVNNLANFVNRVLVLTRKYYDGLVPVADPASTIQGPEGDEIQISDWMKRMAGQIQAVDGSIRQFAFRDALMQVMDLSSQGNQILQVNEPWKRIKSDPLQVQGVMYTSLQIVTALARMIRPFLPFTADRLDELLHDRYIGEHGRIDQDLTRLREGQGILESGHCIGEPGHLFDRIPDELIDAQIAKLHAHPSRKEGREDNDKPVELVDLKPEIQYEQFAGLDLRSGTILRAAKVPKADRLLALEVDLGFEQRTIVSGIAEHFTPEAIVGQQVLVLANLAPRTLKGIESRGMILMATGLDGKLVFVQPGQPVPNGCVIN